MLHRRLDEAQVGEIDAVDLDLCGWLPQQGIQLLGREVPNRCVRIEEVNAVNLVISPG